MSSGAETARFIRRLARWAPWACIAMALVTAGGTVLAIHRGVDPFVAWVGLITPTVLNLGAAALIRALRPLMYHNADAMEALDAKVR